MATKKEKKLDHIQVKDNGIKLSQDIGDKLADAKTLLENEIIDGLLKHSNETNLNRYRIVQNINLRNYQYLSDKVISKVKKDVKTSLKDDNTVNLTNKQVVNMSSQINKGLLFLQESAVRTYQDTLTNILLRCKSAGDLKEQLQKHIDSGIDVGVIYKDGKNYQFDTYWEMKARTDIQNDIGSNMVKTGQENGVIFYIAAYFGDCAKDHVEYQGKIYVDKNWESNAPKDRLEEIRSYINSHDVKTVQEVMEAPAYFTTRPNCRHYFQYIDIDSVLGAKNNDDVNKLRDERNLNFNGKYKPEKYEALQKQRLNERKIRAEKKAIDKLEHELALKPGDKNIQSQIKIGEANVRRYQTEQRDLINQYNNLERRYDREALGMRMNMGTRKTLTHEQNSSIIDVEIDEMTPCLRKNGTNEIVSTHFEEVAFKKYKGFKFDWSKKTSDNSKLEALYAEGDDRIQGLLSYRDSSNEKAIYVELVESAKHNNGFYLKNTSDKEYNGVGAHLFAQAVKHSYEAGYNGFIYFTAKSKLIDYYIKELGATQLFGQKMIIDENAAKNLFVRYYGEEEYKKYATNN